MQKIKKLLSVALALIVVATTLNYPASVNAAVVASTNSLKGSSGSSVSCSYIEAMWNDCVYDFSDMTVYYRKDGTIDLHLPYDNHFGQGSEVYFVNGKGDYGSISIQLRAYDSKTKKWSAWTDGFGSDRVKLGANTAVKSTSSKTDSLKTGFNYTVGKNVTKIEVKITLGNHSNIRDKANGKIVGQSVYTSEVKTINIKRTDRLFLKDYVTLDGKDLILSKFVYKQTS